MDTKSIIKIINNPRDFNSLITEIEKLDYQYIDLFDNQIKELIEIKNIKCSEKHYEDLYKKYKKNNFGNIIVYPWRKSALRILQKNDFLELLTSRNKNLISASEQSKFTNSKVSIAGLSVGSNIVRTVVMQGVCKNIKIADNDTLSTSNLNRVSFDLFSVGKNKTIITAQKLYEINPYINLEIFPKGLDENNIENFISNADIIFDEIDNLKMKITLRLLAKKAKIPVIMITDNGDNIMIDIERYDIKNNLALFNNLLSENDIKTIQSSGNNLTIEKRVALSLKIVHAENATEKMRNSLLEVGTTLKTWPQLGTASALAGAVGSYIVKKISCGESLNGGRTHFSIDAVLVPNYNSDISIKKRKKHAMGFLAKLNNKNKS